MLSDMTDLIGDLSEIRLYDLVKPLVDGKKSGLMAVKGTEPAEIYIEGGQIVHARTDTRIGEEAFPSIMDLDNGRVTFNWRTSPEERTVRLPTGEIMSNWSQREEEWKKIRQAVPSVRGRLLPDGGQRRPRPDDPGRAVGHTCPVQRAAKRR